MAYPLSWIRKRTGNRRSDALFSASQNSPSLVAPSPPLTSTIPSPFGAPGSPGIRWRLKYLSAWATPTACRNCVPTQLEWTARPSERFEKCEGICLPPEEGSEAAPQGSGQLLKGGQSQAGGQGAIPVVGEDPIGLRPEQSGGGGGDRLVAGGTDLEESLVLPLQGDLPQIHLPGNEHDPIGGFELLGTKRGSVFEFALQHRIVAVPSFADALRHSFKRPGIVGGGSLAHGASVPAVRAGTLGVGQIRVTNQGDKSG